MIKHPLDDVLHFYSLLGDDWLERNDNLQSLAKQVTHEFSCGVIEFKRTVFFFFFLPFYGLSIWGRKYKCIGHFSFPFSTLYSLNCWICSHSCTFVLDEKSIPWFYFYFFF